MLYHGFYLTFPNGKFFCGPFSTLERARFVKSRMIDPARYVIACKSIPAHEEVWREVTAK